MTVTAALIGAVKWGAWALANCTIKGAAVGTVKWLSWALLVA